MPTISLSVKTEYGEIRVSGESPEELLKALDWLTKNFVTNLNDKVALLVEKHSQDKLKGIIELRHNQPIIVFRDEISHYESIGLLFYCLKDNQASGKEIKEYLNASGKKVSVPARFHEMVKRGYIFKPNTHENYYKLTTRGVKWIEDEVLPRLKEKLDSSN